VPECQKVKNGGFDQCGPEQFGIESLLSQSEKNAQMKGLIRRNTMAAVGINSSQA